MAQIYRWTDANGGVHYSQAPPAEGSYTRVNSAASSSSSGSDNGLTSFVKQSEQQDAADAKAHDAEMQAKAKRAEQCAKARERISFLEENIAHRLQVKGPDGEPARMTDEQHDQEVAQAHAAEAASCN